MCKYDWFECMLSMYIEVCDCEHNIWGPADEIIRVVVNLKFIALFLRDFILIYAHMSGYVCHIITWCHFWNGVPFF